MILHKIVYIVIHFANIYRVKQAKNILLGNSNFKSASFSNSTANISKSTKELICSVF